MNLTKLGTLAIRLAPKNLSQRFFSTGTTMLHSLAGNKPTVSGKKEDEDDELEKPIKFSTSEAAKWDPVLSRTGGTDNERPWFQTYVVVASTAIFLIYFCMLREENDVDQKLTKDLTDHFHGEAKVNLEKSQRAYLEWSQKKYVRVANERNQ